MTADKKESVTGTWVHVFEEDTPEGAVFRPEDADIPLSRFDIVFVPRSTIGNVEVFTRQVFGSALLGLQTAITGWELFNLERVFPGYNLVRNP